MGHGGGVFRLVFGWRTQFPLFGDGISGAGRLTSLSKIPPGFNYSDVSELRKFSNLRLKWWIVEGGVRQLLKQRYVLEYVLTYQDYNDFQPYLKVTTGSRRECFSESTGSFEPKRAAADPRLTGFAAVFSQSWQPFEIISACQL